MQPVVQGPGGPSLQEHLSQLPQEMPWAPLARGFPKAENRLWREEGGVVDTYKFLLHRTRSFSKGRTSSQHTPWMDGHLPHTSDTRVSSWVTKWARLLAPCPDPAAPPLRPPDSPGRRDHSLLCEPASPLQLQHGTTPYFQSLT